MYCTSLGNLVSRLYSFECPFLWMCIPLKGQCHEIFDHFCCLKDSTYRPHMTRKKLLRKLFHFSRFDCKVQISGVSIINDHADTQFFSLDTAVFKF